MVVEEGAGGLPAGRRHPFAERLVRQQRPVGGIKTVLTHRVQQAAMLADQALWGGEGELVEHGRCRVGQQLAGMVAEVLAGFGPRAGVDRSITVVMWSSVR